MATARCSAQSSHLDTEAHRPCPGVCCELKLHRLRQRRKPCVAPHFLRTTSSESRSSTCLSCSVRKSRRRGVCTHAREHARTRARAGQRIVSMPGAHAKGTMSRRAASWNARSRAVSALRNRSRAISHPGAGHGVERGQERAAGPERRDHTVGHLGRVSQALQERPGLRLVLVRTPREGAAARGGSRRVRERAHSRPVSGGDAAKYANRRAVRRKHAWLPRSLCPGARCGAQSSPHEMLVSRF